MAKIVANSGKRKCWQTLFHKTLLVLAVARLLRDEARAQNGSGIVAWGDNTYGQINVPPGLTNVIGIAAGQNHSVALRGDGRIVGCRFASGISPIYRKAARNRFGEAKEEGLLVLM